MTKKVGRYWFFAGQSKFGHHPNGGLLDLILTTDNLEDIKVTVHPHSTYNMKFYVIKKHECTFDWYHILDTETSQIIEGRNSSGHYFRMDYGR